MKKKNEIKLCFILLQTPVIESEDYVFTVCMLYISVCINSFHVLNNMKIIYYQLLLTVWRPALNNISIDLVLFIIYP